MAQKPFFKLNCHSVSVDGITFDEGQEYKTADYRDGVVEFLATILNPRGMPDDVAAVDYGKKPNELAVSFYDQSKAKGKDNAAATAPVV